MYVCFWYCIENSIICVYFLSTCIEVNGSGGNGRNGLRDIISSVVPGIGLCYVIIVTIIAVHFYWFLPVIRAGNTVITAGNMHVSASCVWGEMCKKKYFWFVL